MCLIIVNRLVSGFVLKIHYNIDIDIELAMGTCSGNVNRSM